MDITAVLIALLGGGGGAGIIKVLCDYIDKRRGKTIEDKVKESVSAAVQPLFDKLEEQDNLIKEMSKRQNHLVEEVDQIHLDTTRTQLYFKMKHDTHNHDTILKIAHRYFVELHGDWVATVDFLAWADKEKIKVPKIVLDAIAENDREK